MDKEKIPQYLGGECRCELYGGCLSSDVGPWSVFESMLPSGVI